MTGQNTVRIYEAADGLRWRYEHESNSEIQADSGQGYTDERDILHAVDTVFCDPPKVLLPDGSEHILPQTTVVKSALALLSLITGDVWDENKLVDGAESLRATAKATLRVKYGMTADDAENVVQERWDAYAAPIVADGVPANPALAQVPVTVEPPTQADLSDRLSEYRERTGKEKTAPSEEKPASSIDALRAAKAAKAARRSAPTPSDTDQP